ncbi:MAG: transporter substrate-binding domain-containing protein [Flavobacteriales bacterium]|nr:transporter substrate-binding domain-containing protein [Flavobacteriales bacterium]
MFFQVKKYTLYCFLFLTTLFLLSSSFCSAKKQSIIIDFTPEEQQWIKEHPIIYHGYEPNWPPYEIYKNGEYKGIVGDYVSIFEKATGIDFRPIKDITWEESLIELQSGEINMVPCAGITDERKSYLLFTKPYISDPLVIVTTLDAEFISGLKGLENKKVSVPVNYYTGEMISKDFPKIQLVYEKSIKECLESVTLGKTKAFVGSLGVVSYYINHHGFTNLKIAAPTIYKNTQIGFAVTKKWEPLRDIIQKVLDKIPQKTHNHIRNKWISVKYDHGLDIHQLIIYSIYIFVFLLIIFLAILMWNKALKKEIIKRKHIEKKLEKTLQNANKISEERKVLLQEIHHRVKNNLQIIISLLRLQKGHSSDEIKERLDEAITRINAISLVHQKVYQTKDLANINLREYICSLTDEIITSFSYENKPNIIINTNIDDVDLTPLIPLALILNELITNSIKYGLKEKDDGVIKIDIQKKSNEFTMNYHDNGTWIDNSDKINFGLSLIDTFTEQLDGSYTRTINGGTTYHFIFAERL